MLLIQHHSQVPSWYLSQIQVLKVVQETKQQSKQSLAEIQAKSIEDWIDSLEYEFPATTENVQSLGYKYSNNLRQQAKEGVK